MDQLPDAARGGGSPLPARRLSNQEFELVIRRAAELQARAAEDPGTDGLTQEEALRIGRELGLSTLHLNRALAEVRGGSAGPATGVDRWFGEAVLEATRTVTGDAGAVRQRLEEHLLRHEFMVVQRRFTDRTLYERATGVVAALGRASSGIFAPGPRLNLQNLAVAVQPLEEGFCYVSISTSLAGRRAGYLAGAAVGGGGGAAVLGTVLGIAVDPVAATLALPVLAGTAFGVRWGYAQEAQRTRTRLESLLDRLEHGELTQPSARGWRR